MKLQVTKKQNINLKRISFNSERRFATSAGAVANRLAYLIDSKGQRLAEGYLGEQNKGIGWLLSWHGPINQSFSTTL